MDNLNFKLDMLYGDLDELQDEVLQGYLDEGDWFYFTDEYNHLFYKMERLEFRIDLYELLSKEGINILWKN